MPNASVKSHSSLMRHACTLHACRIRGASLYHSRSPPHIHTKCNNIYCSLILFVVCACMHTSLASRSESKRTQKSAFHLMFEKYSTLMRIYCVYMTIRQTTIHNPPPTNPPTHTRSHTDLCGRTSATATSHAPIRCFSRDECFYAFLLICPGKFRFCLAG